MGQDTAFKQMTKTQAHKALTTEYATDFLDGYTVKDLQDFTRFATDGVDFYTIDESNYKEWILCDSL